MLGGKLNFNPMMRPSAMQESSISSRESKENDNKSNKPIENDEIDYEKIVTEKTAVVSKKKPKMRAFNSNMNMTSNMNDKKSIVEDTMKPLEGNKKENCPFDEEIKEVNPKEEKANFNEMNNDVNSVSNPVSNQTEDRSKYSLKNETKKSKFDFTSIEEKQEDIVPDVKVLFTANIQNSSTVKPSVLFDFDDSSVIDNAVKNSSALNKNKLGENSSSGNKKTVDKKIKFLFEDE
jgi:hypothetical protein